jgi:DtxR family transcriptional regulator, Mn-dependent transcriptional regulator
MPSSNAISEYASESIQNYLKAIYNLIASDHNASGQEIASVLKVSAPGVTKMLQHLAANKLIYYTPYQPVTLTELGEKIALEVIRHHRLLELYLMESLGYGWERVHAEAERLEHHISEEFEDIIERLLGFPEYDPHGDPIPSRDGKMPPIPTETLLSQRDGSLVIVRRVTDEDPSLLIYLAEHKLRPKAVVLIEEREPFGGSLNLLIDNNRVRVSPDAARSVFVEPAQLERQSAL